MGGGGQDEKIGGLHEKKSLGVSEIGGVPTPPPPPPPPCIFKWNSPKSFSSVFLSCFVLNKLATNSIRVKVANTVQTFNSCTSRPDVCHCLVVQTPRDNIPIKYDRHINDPRSLRIKVTFSSRPFMQPCP